MWFLAPLFALSAATTRVDKPQTYCNDVLQEALELFTHFPDDALDVQASVARLKELPEGPDGCDDASIARAHALADEGVGLLRAQILSTVKAGRADLSFLEDGLSPRRDCSMALREFLFAVEVDPFDANAIDGLETAELICVPGVRTEWIRRGPIARDRYWLALQGIALDEPALALDWRDRVLRGLSCDRINFVLHPIAFPPESPRGMPRRYHYAGKSYAIDLSDF